jgi:hypothetical protein
VQKKKQKKLTIEMPQACIGCAANGKSRGCANRRQKGSSHCLAFLELQPGHLALLAMPAEFASGGAGFSAAMSVLPMVYENSAVLR